MCSTWTYNLFIPCVRHKYVIMLALCFSTNTQSIHTMCFTLNPELVHSMYLSWTRSSFYTMCLIWVTQFIAIMCSSWPHSLTIIFCVYINKILYPYSVFTCNQPCVHVEHTIYGIYVLCSIWTLNVSITYIHFEHIICPYLVSTYEHTYKYKFTVCLTACRKLCVFSKCVWLY
jgi:hypothetical protein